jgi:hypothetical protein
MVKKVTMVKNDDDRQNKTRIWFEKTSTIHSFIYFDNKYQYHSFRCHFNLTFLRGGERKKALKASKVGQSIFQTCQAGNYECSTDERMTIS